VDLFSELENLGFSGLDNLEIYTEEEKKYSSSVVQEEVHIKTPDELEEDYIYDKSYNCPVCDHDFKSKTMKSNKAKFLNTDIDLRPLYQHIDSVKYDVVACPRCGYAALTRSFGPMTSMQIRKIKEEVSSHYYKNPVNLKTYSYEEAIERGKLALLTAVVKPASDSEKGYICLKIAWLYRGWAEYVQEEDSEGADFYREKEAVFLKKAYEGMVSARKKESFPICGMDEVTFDYMLAALAYETDAFEVSAKLIGEILVHPKANSRIKDKTRELKNLLKQAVIQRREKK